MFADSITLIKVRAMIVYLKASLQDVTSNIVPFVFIIEGSCNGSGDGVSDTPPERDNDITDCPGLVPYDKDRDLFDESTQTDLNVGDTSSCGDASKVCTNAGGTTCAAW